jgi:hypothetical protein
MSIFGLIRIVVILILIIIIYFVNKKTYFLKSKFRKIIAVALLLAVFYSLNFVTFDYYIARFDSPLEAYRYKARNTVIIIAENDSFAYLVADDGESNSFGFVEKVDGYWRYDKTNSSLAIDTKVITGINILTDFVQVQAEGCNKKLVCISFYAIDDLSQKISVSDSMNSVFDLYEFTYSNGKYTSKMFYTLLNSTISDYDIYINDIKFSILKSK